MLKILGFNHKEKTIDFIGVSIDIEFDDERKNYLELYRAQAEVLYYPDVNELIGINLWGSVDISSTKIKLIEFNFPPEEEAKLLEYIINNKLLES